MARASSTTTIIGFKVQYLDFHFGQTKSLVGLRHPESYRLVDRALVGRFPGRCHLPAMQRFFSVRAEQAKIAFIGALPLNMKAHDAFRIAMIGYAKHGFNAQAKFRIGQNLGKRNTR